MTRSHRFALLALLIALGGCGGETTPSDAGMDAGRGDVDGGPMDTDAGPNDTDAGPDGADSGPDEVDSGPDDSDAGPPADAGPASDAGPADVDAGRARDGGPTRDAGPQCQPGGIDTCTTGTCVCCPAGGPAMNCLCSGECRRDADCSDFAGTTCNRPSSPPNARGICAPAGFRCAWGSICASPDTPIATADGERAIAELAVGDVVWTVDEGERVLRPIQRIGHTPVLGHAVVRVALANGSVLEISGGHPTADGRTFAELAPGDDLDGVPILELSTVLYEPSATYDIRPASDTGTYIAGGVLIGSTL